MLPVREMWEEGHGKGKLGGGEKGVGEGGCMCNGVEGRGVFVNGSNEIDTPSLTTDNGELKAPHIVHLQLYLCAAPQIPTQRGFFRSHPRICRVSLAVCVSLFYVNSSTLVQQGPVGPGAGCCLSTLRPVACIGPGP
jgi:hypothetical protein